MFIITGVSVCFSIIRSLTFLPLYGAKCVNLKLGTFYPTIFKNLISIFITTTISIGIKIIFNIDSWLTLIIAAIITCIISIMFSLFFTATKDERHKIKMIINTKFKKVGNN